MRRFEVGSNLGLAEAREKAEVLKRQIKDGADPTLEKREARKRAVSAYQGIGTFGSIVDAYFESGPGTGLRTKLEQINRVKSVFAEFLGRTGTEIVSSGLQLAIDVHPAKVSAARAFGYLMPIIKWAKKRGLMMGEFDLEKPLQDAARQRVLTLDELGTLLPALTGKYGRCCKFILFTASRRNEARFATWGQVDLEGRVWTIPGEQRKDVRSQGRRRARLKEALVIPLSRQAVALLNHQRELEVQRRELQSISEPIGPEDWVFVGQCGGALLNWDRWLKIQIVDTGIEGWSAHALRRTTATIAGDLGAPPHVVSAMLGHTNIGGELVAGYNKSRYLREHGEMLQQVADVLEQIEAGKMPSLG